MVKSLHLSYWLAPALIALILFALSSTAASTRLRRVYRAHFVETARERLFLASVGFFVTIAVVRTLTYLIHAGIGPFHDIQMGGRHIHHLVWGIALLLLVGYAWLIEIDTTSWIARITAMLFGVGAALTLDEFALWLNLRDVYWQREGRVSVEAIFLFGALLTLGIVGRSFLNAAAGEFVKVFKRRSS